jgi:Uma2 family endonuclease
MSIASGDRLLTTADLEAFPSELPTGPVRYELDNGRLVIKGPATYDRGTVQCNVVTELELQGTRRGFGRSWASVAVILWREPDRVVVPIASFITNASLPVRCSPEDYLETIPELVVEVVSKNDTKPEVLAKVSDYLTAGVRVVWLADPVSRTVTVYRAGAEPEVLGEDDILTVEELIPGFRMRVALAFGE